MLVGRSIQYWELMIRIQQRRYIPSTYLPLLLRTCTIKQQCVGDGNRKRPQKFFLKFVSYSCTQKTKVHKSSWSSSLTNVTQDLRSIINQDGGLSPRALRLRTIIEYFTRLSQHLQEMVVAIQCHVLRLRSYCVRS